LRAAADPVQQIGLRGFERDQPAENVEQVQQIGRVLGQPMIRLDRVERRRRAAVADDRPRPLPAAVAEPTPSISVILIFICVGANSRL
jgi:hypothetical protein